MTTYVGIDPGRYGAFAILDEGGGLESVVDLPTMGAEPVAADVAALLTAIDDPSRLFVALEEPFVMTPRASLLTQGIGYGILLGVVGGLGVRHVRVTPKRWKAAVGIEMGSHLSSSEKKQRSLDRATELWPQSAHNWSRKKDDGRAEAAMIGLAGLRTL
jgi:crossover junction endodeoxyribonuclease RuvC